LSEPVYIIGIDLGTTNSVAAYTEANITKGETSDIKILKIPQLTGPGTVEKREILPSFILMHEKTMIGMRRLICHGIMKLIMLLASMPEIEVRKSQAA